MHVNFRVGLVHYGRSLVPRPRPAFRRFQYYGRVCIRGVGASEKRGGELRRGHKEM